MATNAKLHQTIHWFRKGLRLHDNPALVKAIENSQNVYPVFILDPWFVENYKVGPNRWRFLQQSLQDLDEGFHKLGGRLFVVRGKPLEVLPKLITEWKITKLTYEVDTEPYAVSRDAQVDKLCNEHNVEVSKMVSHTLLDSQKIIDKNKGNPPTTYQSFQKIFASMPGPPKPVAAPETDTMNGCKLGMDNYSDKYSVPTLKELRVNDNDCGPILFPGGETEALVRMNKCIKRTNWICTFEKPKTEPNSLQPSTTVLSPYLKFGCLSVRTFYWKLADIYKQVKKHSQPPVSLHGQLLWREFFYTVGYGTPNFNKMEGNPICKQIPWKDNPEYLAAWKEGRTGFPFIDAIMIQLKSEGWIHHLARHSVACFLTRGDLFISWEEGQKVFEEYLLDADWHLNAGNWMWLSASSFFYQYFRVYSPIAFGKKTDKMGEYIKKYIPKLKKFPEKYIYEPWTAPSSIQQTAGCIIGKDYPKPIVDHAVVHKRNIQWIAKAYEENKKAQGNGDSKKSKEKPSKKRKTEAASSPAKKTKS